MSCEPNDLGNRSLRQSCAGGQGFPDGSQKSSEFFHYTVLVNIQYVVYLEILAIQQMTVFGKIVHMIKALQTMAR